MGSLLSLAALEVELWPFIRTVVLVRPIFDQNQNSFVFGSVTGQRLEFSNFFLFSCLDTVNCIKKVCHADFEKKRLYCLPLFVDLVAETVLSM